MRNRLVLVLVTALGVGACGGGSGDPDVNIPPDAITQSGDTKLTPPQRGFQIISPTLEIAPGAEITYCYYFKTTNTDELAIKRWLSHMTPGSHHLILYFTSTEQQPAGTLSTRQCGIVSGGVGPVWTYSAQTSDSEALLPADDGAGVPVGQPVKAGQAGFLQMHYLNSTDRPIYAHVELNAYAYDEGIDVTPAAPFVTYNTEILIEPGSPVNPTRASVEGVCPVPRNPDGTRPKFFTMTTHTHKQGVRTFVKDDTSMVVESTNWEHPIPRAWTTPPFYSFASDKLAYRCEYANPNNYRIETGDSAATAEMCMAVGYYFPAVGGRGHLCLNSLPVY